MSPKAHIILAEDGVIERQVIERVLALEGYRLTVVENGQQALNAYLRHGADLIVADWIMPLMDGLELVRRVRAIPAPVPPFIIMLTGRIDRDDLVTGLDAGADDYLTKPFDRRELLARVRGGARTQQLMRELHRNNDLLRRLAMTDPLTDLPNRRAFDEWLRAERQWPDADRPFGVIIADLDGLKVVNDQYGHEAGDAALREIAGRMQAAVRTSDLVARYGGDEFAAGLPDCDRAAAEAIAERMAAAVSAMPIHLGDGVSVAITICVGTAVHPDDGAPEQIMAVADARLYTSKRARTDRAA